MRVKVILEAKGNLYPVKTDSQKGESSARGLPMKAIANLTYDEKGFQTTDSVLRTARYYHEAKAQISVSKKPMANGLRENRRYVVCEHGDRLRLFSCTGGLTRTELELLTVPANSILVDRIAAFESSETVIPDELLANLLNVDTITANHVIVRKTATDEDKIRYQIEGQASGEVDGGTTSVELNGKIAFDRQLGFVTWVALTLAEERSVTPTTPGFQVEARLRLAIEPVNEQKYVDETIQTLTDDLKDPSLLLLDYSVPDSNIKMLHHREWYVINESPKHSILRMVDDGKTIAQCNLRKLPTVQNAADVNLDKFKRDVVKNLASASPTVISAEELSTPVGLRFFRVQVTGKVSETAIQWIYYLGISESGEALSCSFTMAADRAEQFGAADHEIISAIRFDEATTTAPKLVELNKRQNSKR